MSDDNASVASETAGPVTTDSLSRKLGRTRQQLKAAVERIINLETREVELVKRLDAMEIRLNQIETIDGDDAKSNESNDSIEGLLDLPEGLTKGVNPTLPKIPEANLDSSVLQGGVGQSGPQRFLATTEMTTGADLGEPETQY